MLTNISTPRPADNVIRHDRHGRIIHKYFSEEQFEHAYDADGGYCMACGVMVESLEHDASFLTCSECGHALVFSAVELVNLNRILKSSRRTA